MVSSSDKLCVPDCRYFKCAQRALVSRGPTMWCRWVNDVCTGGKCKYAQCVQRKLVADGKCSLFIKRITVEDTQPEQQIPRAAFGAKAKRKLDELEI